MEIWPFVLILTLTSASFVDVLKLLLMGLHGKGTFVLAVYASCGKEVVDAWKNLVLGNMVQNLDLTSLVLFLLVTVALVKYHENSLEIVTLVTFHAFP